MQFTDPRLFYEISEIQSAKGNSMKFITAFPTYVCPSRTSFAHACWNQPSPTSTLLPRPSPLVLNLAARLKSARTSKHSYKGRLWEPNWLFTNSVEQRGPLRETYMIR